MSGNETVIVEGWIVSRLAAAAAALDAISTGLSTRVYNGLAPDGVGYPFIVYQAQSPPQVVRGVGSEEFMVDTIYTVKAIAQGSDFIALGPVAVAIRSALVAHNGDTTVGGDIIICQYERQVQMIEPGQSKQFRHLGGEYRIQAKAA